MQDIAHERVSAESLKSWLIDWLAREMDLDHSKVDPTRSFLSYGMDSMKAMTMVGDIEAMLSLRLAPTLAWDYPDISSLSSYLAEQVCGGQASAAATASVGNLTEGWAFEATRRTTV